MTLYHCCIQVPPGLVELGGSGHLVSRRLQCRNRDRPAWPQSQVLAWVVLPYCRFRLLCPKSISNQTGYYHERFRQLAEGAICSARFVWLFTWRSSSWVYDKVFYAPPGCAGSLFLPRLHRAAFETSVVTRATLGWTREWGEPVQVRRTGLAPPIPWSTHAWLEDGIQPVPLWFEGHLELIL